MTVVDSSAPLVADAVTVGAGTADQLAHVAESPADDGRRIGGISGGEPRLNGSNYQANSLVDTLADLIGAEVTDQHDRYGRVIHEDRSA